MAPLDREEIVIAWGQCIKAQGPNIEARKAESESSWKGTVRSLPTI